MEPRKYEIEEYVEDWHWDEASYEIAIKMGRFLYGFLDYLEMSGASERVLRKESSNIWNIGIFYCQYGYLDEFSPKIFNSPPFYLTEFKRKVSDTPYALQSYVSTCNKLSKYVKDKIYEDQEEFEFDLSDDIDDFCKGLKLLQRKAQKGINNQAVSGFSAQIKTLQTNFVRELTEVQNQEELSGRLRLCASVLEDIARQIDAIPLEGNRLCARIAPELRQDALELKKEIELLLAIL